MGINVQTVRILASSSLFTQANPEPAILSLSQETRKMSSNIFSVESMQEAILLKERLREVQIRELCRKTKEVLLKESNVVNVDVPVTVVGDIHGFVVCQFFIIS